MSALQIYTVNEPFLKVGCSLGEGPFWDDKTNVLRFVDIMENKLHFVDLKKEPSSHWAVDLPNSIGVTANMAGEANKSKIIFGGKKGVGIYDVQTGSHHYIKEFWNEEDKKTGKLENLRANDGAIDSKGRFWVGTMHDFHAEPTVRGTLFRMDADHSLHRVIEDVSIPNGTSWSKDDKTMFFTDSPTKCIDAYDFDSDTGRMSNQRPFFKLEGEGVPDGHTVDEEGHIWCAIYGGWKVVRISPEGKIVAEIRLPTRCITCPVFVGEYLYITSAKEQESEKFPSSVPHGGDVFRCHVGVKRRYPPQEFGQEAKKTIS